MSGAHDVAGKGSLRNATHGANVQAKRKRGRPDTYDQDVADWICDRLAEGEQLDDICKEPDMPPASTVRRWAYAGREPFASDYARARSIGHERMVAEILAIGDADYRLDDGSVDNAAVQQARIMCENRKWLLSKMLPRTFGDKVTAEITGDPDQPLVTRIELVAVRSPAREIIDADVSPAIADRLTDDSKP